MSALLAGTNQWAATGLAALLNTLWYAAAVVALAWIILRYARRVNAATRYWIWTAVLGFILILPFLPAAVAHVQGALVAPAHRTAVGKPLATVPAAVQATEHLAPITVTVSTAPGSNPWPLWLMAVWIAAAVWQLGRLLMGAVSVRRLKGRAETAPIEKLPLDLRRRVRVLASNEIGSPAAVGYLRPAVVVPQGLLERLEETERQDVLLHELAHLARYDDWLNLATRAVGALLALHPLAPFVLGRIEREREMACDDFVVAHTGSAGNYARSLARLHDLRSRKGTRLLAPALVGRKVSLADRIESLLRRGREFSARPSLAKLSLSAFLLVLLLGAGGLIPSWVAIAQTSAAAPKFEVASIRPSKVDRHHFDVGIRWLGDRFRGNNITISDLIDYTYRLRPQQVDGLPPWAKSQFFIVQALVPPAIAKGVAATKELPLAQREQALARSRRTKSLMLESLLAERFKLRFHRTTRRLPVYELVVAKGGPKLTPDNNSGTGAIVFQSTSFGYARTPHFERLRLPGGFCHSTSETVVHCPVWPAVPPGAPRASGNRQDWPYGPLRLHAEMESSSRKRGRDELSLQCPQARTHQTLWPFDLHRDSGTVGAETQARQGASAGSGGGPHRATHTELASRLAIIRGPVFKTRRFFPSAQQIKPASAPATWRYKIAAPLPLGKVNSPRLPLINPLHLSSSQTALWLAGFAGKLSLSKSKRDCRAWALVAHNQSPQRSQRQQSNRTSQ